MHIEQLIDTLVKRLHLAHQKDDRGNYHLTINPKTEIMVTPLDPGVFLSTTIMPISEPQKKEALFIYLMRANLLGQGTGGGAIGIDPSEKLLTLSLSLPYEVNYKMFAEGLEDLTNYLDYWREEIGRFLNTANSII